MPDPLPVLEHARMRASLAALLLSSIAVAACTGGSGGLEALRASTGEALWHSRIGTVTNAPITYELDGLQYVVAASGATLFAFVLN